MGYPGIADRMQKEITALAPNTMKIKIIAPPRGSTPSGSVAPSWLPSPPSSPCGSPRRSTTSPVPPSSTGSASRVLSNFSVRSAFGPEPVLNDKKKPTPQNKHLQSQKKKKKKKKTTPKKKTPQKKKKKKKKKKK